MNLEMTDIRVQVTDGPETRQILNGVDLSIEPGEIVAITGESGSGKSTLIAVAGLLRPPTAGTVSVMGQAFTTSDGEGRTGEGRSAKHRTRVRRSEIGLVFQTSNLFPSLTAVEQLELVAHIGGSLDTAARTRARELLERVGMTDRAHQRPSRLSGGERQRVALARSLMNRPSVVLADEPTASLDAGRGREIMALLVESARESGAATMIVTHVPEQLEGWDRMFSLEGGHLIEIRTQTGGSPLAASYS